ncbi:MAG: MBL fold metallo-hydrolase [Actinomycetota bacterium]
MKVRIHRGAHEIGGSCVEVESADGDRLVLDVGAPLVTVEGEEPTVPAVDGLIEEDPALKGVVITHAHQDHWGLVDKTLPSVPLYMGEATHRILKDAAFWVSGLTRTPAGSLSHREPFELGGFRITPFLNDHSAFDAYSLLVKADGRRLFYTGDIRGHGRKAGIFEQLLRKPPKDIDVLLTEGTNIRPADNGEATEPTSTETDVEHACVELFKDTPGMVLAMYSAQNIDRLVTLYRAAKHTGRTLVMTLYGASIAEATGNENIPKAGWEFVRVFVPGWQQAKVKEAGQFDRVDQIKSCRVFEEELAEDPSRWVVSFGMPMATRLDKVGCFTGAHLIWSMWPGYLKDDKQKPLLAFLEERGIPLTIEHTSGHASIHDLQRLAEALAPERVVPIHSFGADRFDDLFEHVEHHPDGEWWKV